MAIISDEMKAEIKRANKSMGLSPAEIAERLGEVLSAEEVEAILGESEA